MAKDLLTEVKSLTAELAKLDDDYKASRQGIIDRLTTLRATIDEQFRSIPEFASTLPTKAKSKGIVSDTVKAKNWLKSTLANGKKMEWVKVQEAYKAAHPDKRKLRLDHHADILVDESGMVSLRK